MSLLRNWWFQPMPADRLALIRICVGGFALWYIFTRQELLAKTARNLPTLFEPVGPVRILGAPLAPETADAIVLATLISGVLFVLGLGTRLVGPVFAALALWTLSYRNSWSFVYHMNNIVVLHAIVLAAARCSDAFSLDALLARRRGLPRPADHWRYGWPVMLISTLTVSCYFLAGLAKVVSELGIAWGTGVSLRSQIAADLLRKDVLGASTPELTWQLYDQVWLFAILAVASLIFELGAPLALANRKLGKLWAVSAFGMHWGIWMIMGIKFRYQLAGLIFASFFDVERPARWILRRLGLSRVESGRDRGAAEASAATIAH